LEKVATGEGRRVDTYLQLKTSHSDKLRGRIIIDSPGFDADSQRTATLRLTDHIVDLSDLVLVFFDARHPEPGAMRDTLSHLVGDTIRRPDATKFIYILNQMDTTAREDNPEAVIGAWQRALAQEGLTAGRFYSIYSPDVAIPIEDEALRDRYESKRDHDLGEIHERIQKVGVERAYRITGTLDKLARHIEDKLIPELTGLLKKWRRLVLWGDAAGAIVIATAVFMVVRLAGLAGDSQWLPPLLLVAAGLFGVLHFRIRRVAANHVATRIARTHAAGLESEQISHAFLFNTRIWHSIFKRSPAGWSQRSKKRLQAVIAEANRYVQLLNDRFTDPSGEQEPAVVPTMAPMAPAPTTTEPADSELARS